MGEILQFPARDVQAEFIDSLNERQLEIFLDIVHCSMQELDQMDEVYKQKCEECRKLKKQIKKLKEKIKNEN